MRSANHPRVHDLASVATMPLLIAALLASPAAAQDAAAPPDPAAALQLQRTEQELRQITLQNDKLAFDNAQAASTAEQARLQAAVDAIPASTTTGKTDVKDGAGQMEANALAALAINSLAQQIAQDAKAAADKAKNARSGSDAVGTDGFPCPLNGVIAASPGRRSAGDPVPLMLLGSDKLTFAHWEEFRFRVCTIEAAYDEANDRAGATLKAIDDRKSVKGGQDQRGAKGGPGLAAVQTAITIGTAAIKLIQLMAPDWEIGGVEVEASERALMAAVSNAYLAADPEALLYWPGQISKLGAGEEVFSALRALEQSDVKSASVLAELDRLIAERTKTLTAAKPAAKPAAQASLDEVSKPAEALRSASGAYALLLKHLNGKDGEALLPIDRVVQESAAAKLLGADGVVLSLAVGSKGGGYYTRRSLLDWVGLAPPYWVSGGVVVDFGVVRPSDQRVFGSGQFACHAGYGRINKIAARINAAQSVTCAPVEANWRTSR